MMEPKVGLLLQVTETARWWGATGVWGGTSSIGGHDEWAGKSE
jgi:hypothetical protein